MNKKVVKLGVVGLRRGLVAKHLIKYDTVELCAICDIDEQTLKEAMTEISEAQRKAGKEYPVAASRADSTMVKLGSFTQGRGILKHILRN